MTEEDVEAEEYGSRRELLPASSHALGVGKGKGEMEEAEAEVEAPTGWRRCFPAKPKEEIKDPEVRQVPHITVPPRPSP